MPSLAKTLSKLSEIMQCIEENEGEIPKYLVPHLQAAEMTVAKKVDEYVEFNDALQAQINQTEQLVEKFKKTLSSLKNVQKRLKDNVKYLMREHDLLEIRGEYRKIRLCNSGGSEGLDLPEDFFEEIKVINDKYLYWNSPAKLKLLEEKAIENINDHHDYYRIIDKQAFNEVVARGDIPGCSVKEKSKHVRFF